ncbi:MAG: type IX secretion system sortase PorU [Bacteroidales bacterium]|nr:type IX secretion system sortase PorU [Bacteroidales bacterium]
MSRLLLIVITYLFSVTFVFSQQNFVGEKILSYNFSILESKMYPNGALFDEAVKHELFYDIPLVKFQFLLIKPIDSITIFIQNIESVSNPLFDNIKNLELAPQYHYEVQLDRNRQVLTIFINPFHTDPNQEIAAYTHFNLFVTTYESNNNIGAKETKSSWKSASVLANDDWYKVKLSTTGVYKITGNDLITMGFPLTNLSVNDIRVFGNGGGMYPEANSGFFYDDLEENAIKIHDLNGNGIFESNDYFIFFGKGPNYWKYDSNNHRFSHSQHLYDDYAYYFINVRNGTNKRVSYQSINPNTPDTIITTFDDFQYYDKDSLNLIKSGKIWYGDEYNIITSHNYGFSFPNIDLTTPVNIKMAVAAKSTTVSQMTVNTSGNTQTIIIPSVSGQYNGDYAAGVSQEWAITPQSQAININVSYNKPTSIASAWMDYIEVQAKRQLTYNGTQLRFRNKESIGNGKLSKFVISNPPSGMVIWDVSNHLHPIEIEYIMESGNATFTIATDELREFIAFTNSFYSVGFNQKIENQNLHGVSDIDYVICYNKKFEAEANELADFHRNNNNLNVYTVDQQLVFNEFSSGAADIAALRNFMRLLYDNALASGKNPPKYLLLFGDASYDYKNRISGNTNFVLTFESASSLNPLSSYSSDDFFGLLDYNEGSNCSGALDIGIGRFIVRTNTEAQQMVDKIKRYYAIHNQPTGANSTLTVNQIPNMADWRNAFCFIGDDQDQNIHISQADYMAELTRQLNPKLNINKIFLDSYVQQTLPGGQRYPEAKQDMNLQVGNGALVINYTGHGGEMGLAHESLLEIADIQKWNNANNLPLFITATCEFTRYEDPSRISAGEYAFLQPNGGMIGLLTTSRVTFSGSNFTLNKYILQDMLTADSLGNYPSIGDLIRISKVKAGSIMNNRNFVLIGDPALKLAFPKHDVITLTVNNIPVQQFSDTIKALSMVTISGQIESDGQKMSGFNGYVYPTIFDKAQNYTTLANDPDSYLFNFKLQKNVIYKGKAVVTNGEFSFTFIVPKDINYSFGNSKISYYAENGQTDANGYYDSLIVGGTNSNVIADNLGPQINLYLNDTMFVDGGITDENPNVLAILFDESGINTTGNGIGHDITLTVDNNSTKSVSLNNFYQTKTNSYQSGYVVYPLSELNEGKHTITLKAWDIYNNSNQVSLSFVVANSESTVISALTNYPNPFTDYTNFVFEHNMAGNSLDVEIQIFDQLGNKVRNLSTTMVNSGYKVSSDQLKWSGRNESGQKLGAGLYHYRVIITSESGQKATDSGKLILLN